MPFVPPFLMPQTALESRSHRGGTKDHLPQHPDQAHAGRQCGQILSQRYTYLPLLSGWLLPDPLTDDPGEMLASAGDDGNVLLWVPSELQTTSTFGEDRSDDKETWRVKHMCRSSGAEIYDLAWSPDGVFFITGSMDNIARIYNAQTGLSATLFCRRTVADGRYQDKWFDRLRSIRTTYKVWRGTPSMSSWQPSLPTDRSISTA